MAALLPVCGRSAKNHFKLVWRLKVLKLEKHPTVETMSSAEYFPSRTILVRNMASDAKTKIKEDNKKVNKGDKQERFMTRELQMMFDDNDQGKSKNKRQLEKEREEERLNLENMKTEIEQVRQVAVCLGSQVLFPQYPPHVH